jgi:hypothetical protein
MQSLVAGLGAVALAAAPAQGVDFRPLVATPLAGSLQIQQSVPTGCTSLDVRPLAVTGGRMEISPAGGLDDGAGHKLFTLAVFSAYFEPFSVHVVCPLHTEDRAFRAIGAQLGASVIFTGVPDGRGGYAFRIPKDQFVIYEVADDNGQSDRSYKHPSSDVVGSITVEGRVLVHVEVPSSLHITGFGIDGDFGGTQIADIVGTLRFPDTDGDGIPDNLDTCPFVPNPNNEPIATPVLTPPPPVTLASCLDRRFGVATAVDVCFGRRVTITNDAPNPFTPGTFLVTWSADDEVDPVVTAQQTVTIVDTTPPRVSCVATRRPTGNAFRVSASDQCDTPVIRLGDFVLANGEVVQIQETGQPGVRLINDTRDGSIRHFLVGKGQATITATDASHNVATAACIK